MQQSLPRLLALAAALAALLAWSATTWAEDSQDSSAAPAGSPSKIKVLIIDGVNNHDWKTTTAATKATLLATGRFEVDVSTSPARNAGAEAWAGWKPAFADYQVVLSNFNDGGRCLWSEETRKAFVGFVHGGGGFVSVHAADNSSSDWPEYNEMIAVGGWGGRKPQTHGSLLRKALENWHADPALQGMSGSHGRRWAFPVKTEQADHPIMKGLPEVWIHGNDELYNSLRGPCKNVTVLASATSKQTRTDEPMAMVIEYGEGRIFHLPLGHVGGAQDVEAVLCVGFQTLLARGTEFAATGKVSIPVPEEFPTAETKAILEPTKISWK